MSANFSKNSSSRSRAHERCSRALECATGGGGCFGDSLLLWLPRLGREDGSANVPAPSSAWSSEEQQKAANAEEAVKNALKWGNREYEQKFGRIFIVCATGKSGTEILEILRRRLHNEDAAELQEAAEEQRKIMQIRLKKWIAG